MPTLTVRFLGVAQLTLDAVPVQLERRHSLALFAYLLLTNRPHSREALATLLAGDLGDDAARKRLRNALADLVEHGLGEYLQISRQSVACNAMSARGMDVSRLDALCDNGSPTDLEGLVWAAERCDWELLTGLTLRDAPAFEIWLVTERERRGRQLRELAHRHLVQLIAGAELESGISLAQRLLAVEPWDEATHRLLMRLFAQNGQVSNALAQFERCRDMLEEELGVEPQPETAALYARLRAGPVVPRHTQPMATDARALVGREEDLEQIASSLLDPTCRLLTIVGVGGSGKTSLALAAAERVSEPALIGDDHPFADGVVTVKFGQPDAGTGPGNPSGWRIVTAIGYRLGLTFHGHTDRLNQLIAHLQRRKMLLILDAMEYLKSGATVLTSMLHGAPGLTILVTSRASIGIAEERARELGGLRVPLSVADIQQAAASQLFLREVRHVNGGVADSDLPYVVQICHLTGGWPLALKIAAGWLGPLTCAEIAQELEQGGALLGEPSQTGGVRQVSIRAIVASAYDGLPDRERRALSRLAVYSGTFNRQAAEAVGVTLPSLVALGERALLERGEQGQYGLHPLVRQHASERRAADPDEDAAARRDHAVYVASLVAQALPSLYTDPDTLARIGSEHANIRLAWNWAVEQRDVTVLAQLWESLGRWKEKAGLHREWTAMLNAAIDRLRGDDSDPASSAILVELLVAKAESLLWQGDLEAAFPLLDEACRHTAAVEHLHLEALISFCRGRLLRFRGGENDAAVEMLHQARILAAATQQPRIEANSLLQLSLSATDSEDYAQAESFRLRAEEGFRALGDRLSLARTTSHQGRLAVYRGDYADAWIALEQSAHTARAFGDRYMAGNAHLFLGIIMDLGHGRHTEADQYFEQALAFAGGAGDPYFDGNVHRAIGRNALHTGDFSRAERAFQHAAERAWDVGNTRAIGESLRSLAQLAHAHEEYAEAEDRAMQALHLSIEQRRRSASATSLLVLGRTRECLGRLSEAAAAYTEAFNLADTLGVPYLRCDAVTGLARVSLSAGDTNLALRYVDEILPRLRTQMLAGSEKPGLVIETCVRVLGAAQDRREVEVLRLGAVLLQRRISALPESGRERYINAYPERREVLRRWQEHVASARSNGDLYLLAAADNPRTTEQREQAAPHRERHPYVRVRGHKGARRHRPRPPA